MSELKFPPSSGYRGPVTALYPRCGGYDLDSHCASCGSTDVRPLRPKNSDLIATLRCQRCGRVTNIRKTERYSTARYSILVNGAVVRESIPGSGLDAVLATILGDMWRQSAEKARHYYGQNYKTVVSTVSHAGIIDRTFQMIDGSMASSGYVYGLEVGESYNLPHFPVSIVRVEDAQQKPTPKSRNGGRSGVDVEQLAEDMGYALWETDPDDYMDQFGEYPSEEEYLMSLDSLSYIGGVDEDIMFVESCIDPDEFPMYDDLLARLKARREELAGPVSSKSRKPARKTGKPKAAGKPTKAKTSANRKSRTASRKAPARATSRRR